MDGGDAIGFGFFDGGDAGFLGYDGGGDAKYMHAQLSLL